MSRVFVSYNQEVEGFVAEVCHCLRRQGGLELYFHPESRRDGEFPQHIDAALRSHDRLLFFLSKSTGVSDWQGRELRKWTEFHAQNGLAGVLFVNLDGAGKELPSSLVEYVAKNLRDGLKDIERLSANSDAPGQCATLVLKCFGLSTTWFDDLPSILRVSYEKSLINEYIKDKISIQWVAEGYPRTWPKATKHEEKDSWHYIENPLNETQHGSYRESTVRVDARVRTHSSSPDPETPALTFPEAGPRAKIINPGHFLNVGVLVSGGIAPGINAVISAIVERHDTYKNALKNAGFPHWQVGVQGYLEGFRALSRSPGPPWIRELKLADVKPSVRRGGSLIPTARDDELLDKDPSKRSPPLEKIVDKLYNNGIDILYIIGGEGSMRAAHAISTVYRRKYPAKHLSVVGVPKTMDNDILWVWQSFGFLSAVEQARESINQLATEAASNPRVCVIQLFGSVSGFVVSHAALGSDVCDLALIPEMDFKMQDVCEYMRKCLERRNENWSRPFGLVVMAETAIPKDFAVYKDKAYVGLTEAEKKALEDFKGHEFVGQTPDDLRTAALKIVSRVLQRYILGVMGHGDKDALRSDEIKPSLHQVNPYWQDFRVFTNEPRHIIRSMEPSVTDVAYGIRLGTMAVDTAMAGYTDCMVSQWLTEYVVVPLKLVVLGRKRLPRDGVFWRTVVSKTGQTENNGLT